MGGGTLLFNPSHGIRFRAHPTSPLGLRTGPPVVPPTGELLKLTDAFQRCLAIKSEANKGAQSRRNSKSNSALSSKLISKSTTNEASSQRGDLTSLLKKIDESIRKSSAVAEPKEISMGEQKKRSSESIKKSSAVAEPNEISMGEQKKRSSESIKKSSAVAEPNGISMAEQKKRSSESIKKSSAVAEPNEISMAEQKKRSSEPKSKEEKLINGENKSTGPPSVFDRLRRDDGNNANASPRDAIKSSGYESTFAILTRDDGKKAVALPRFDIKASGLRSNFNKLKRDNWGNAVALTRFDKKSSGPSSNFDKLIIDNSNNAIALPHDYKPPRPTSRFVRRSPIPISDPAQEETNTIPRKHPQSFIREPVKREMSVSDQLQAIVGKKQSPPKSEQTGNLNLREILKLNTTPKYREIPKALTELKPQLNLEATTIPELTDIPKAEPELVLDSELEVMTGRELKSIAKARGLKGYSKLTKAGLLEILKGTST